MSHAGHVMPHSEFRGNTRVADVYAMAAAIPNVLDGIYCNCACAEHADHYSLLDCFVTEHAARCDVCLSEAAVAFRMTQEQSTLDEIRVTIDRMYAR